MLGGRFRSGKLSAAAETCVGPSSFLKKMGCLGAESGGGGTEWPRPAGGGLMDEMNGEKLGGRVGEEGMGLPRPCPCPCPCPGGVGSGFDSDWSGPGLPGAMKSNFVEAEPRPRPRPAPSLPPGEEEELEKGIKDCLAALEKLIGFGRESALPMLPLIWGRAVSVCLYSAPELLRDLLSNTSQAETYLVMFGVLVQF
jgi:hypothetical protein